jgi:hypothetical protein
MRAADEVKKLALAKPKTASLEEVHSKDLLLQGAKHQDGNGRVGYFSLPGEIRNQIMHYALAPGEIDLNEVDPEQQRSGTEWFLTQIRRLVNDILRQFPKLASLPRGIPELVAPQLFAIFPYFYADMQLSAYILDELIPAEKYLLKRLCGLTSPQTSWRNITGPILNKVLDQLLKRSPISKLGWEGHPVPQLQASCKQAYLEGHELFYTLNTFYLPRGPTWHTYYYFKNLQHQHKLLIRSIVIRFGLEDLTAEDFRDAEAGVKARGYFQETNAEVWTEYIAPLAMQSFTRKLVFVRSFSTLEHVRIETDYGTLDLDGASLKQSLKGDITYRGHAFWPEYSSFYSVCAKEVRDLARETYSRLKGRLEHLIKLFGWTMTKVWLQNGAPGRAWLDG